MVPYSIKDFVGKSTHFLSLLSAKTPTFPYIHRQTHKHMHTHTPIYAHVRTVSLLSLDSRDCHVGTSPQISFSKDYFMYIKGLRAASRTEKLLVGRKRLGLPKDQAT